MNTVAEIHRINEAELENGLAGTSASWHAKYADAAWVYVGNLPLQLTEGDVICVMSQFGEVEDINLVRDEGTGKSRGFCFLKYEDARSCILAVDNLTGSKVLGRTLRVDHVENYRLPKHLLEKEEAELKMDAGHAYEGKELATGYRLDQGQDLFAGPPADDAKESREKHKEAKRKRKEERAARRREKEERRREKEEKKRKRRAKKYAHDSDERHHHRSKKHRRKRSSRSRSPSRSPSD